MCSMEATIGGVPYLTFTVYESPFAIGIEPDGQPQSLE